MLDVPSLEQRRQQAILQLDDFLCRECGGVRIPGAEAAQIVGRNFISGWRLTIQPLQEQREMNVCVDGLFPFVAPRFQLVGGPTFLTWPHVEKDGALCLGDETFTVDPLQPVLMARQLLVEMAFPLLRASESGSNREDFRTEFYSYWNASMPAGGVPIRSLLLPQGPSRAVRIWRGQHFAVVGETEESILQWLKNLYGAQKQFDDTEASCLLWVLGRASDGARCRRSRTPSGVGVKRKAVDTRDIWIDERKRALPGRGDCVEHRQVGRHRPTH